MEGLTVHTQSRDAIPGKCKRAKAKTKIQEKEK